MVVKNLRERKESTNELKTKLPKHRYATNRNKTKTHD